MKRDDKRFFVSGGTLGPNDASYVHRSADDELFESLKQGEFCYVLNARQMGKSSLMVTTAKRLQEGGIKAVLLDLTSIGQNVSLEQWYYGLLAYACDQLGISDGLDAFWKQHSQFSPHQRWLLALRQYVLPSLKTRLVIFIDEIDVVQSLPFPTDEFFAGIRELYNRRSSDPELERLTFCLLGVATPAELIKDNDITPFNVGKRIVLADFTFEEASVLAHGLNHIRDGYGLLKRVLYWTDGHPYLTQRVCRAIAADPGVCSARDVDELCEQVFVSQEGREVDDNFLFVRDRLIDEGNPWLLKMYLQVLTKRPHADTLSASALAKLLLTGAVKVENGRARVRNRLYERGFDRKWVLNHLPGADARRIRRAFFRGALRAGAVGGLVSLALLGLTIWSLHETARAEQSKKDAEQSAEQYRRMAYDSDIALAQQMIESDSGEAAHGVALLQSCADLAKPESPGWEWSYLYEESHPWSPLAPLPAKRVRTPPLLEAVDGEGLIAAGDGDELELLSMGDGHLVYSQRFSSRITAMRLSPNGKTLALGFPSQVTLWDLVKRTETERFSNPRGLVVRKMAFSPSGRYLAVLSGDFSKAGSASLYDLSRKSSVLAWPISMDEGVGEPVFAMEENGFLFTNGDEIERCHGQRIETVFSSRDQPILIPTEEPDRVYLIGKSSGIIKEFDATKLRVSNPLVAIGPKGVQTWGNRFDGADHSLLLCVQQGMVGFALMDMTSYAQTSLFAMQPQVFYGAISERNGLLYASSLDSIYRCLIRNGQARTYHCPKDNPTDHAVAFTPDGQSLLMTAGGEEPQVVSVATGGKRTLSSLGFLPFEIAGTGLPAYDLDERHGFGYPRRAARIIRDSGPLYSAQLDKDGDRLLTLSKSHTAQLWDLSNGSVLAAQAGAESASLSPDGIFVATLTWDTRPDKIGQNGAVRGEASFAGGDTAWIWSVSQGWQAVDRESSGSQSILMSCFSGEISSLTVVQASGEIARFTLPGLKREGSIQLGQLSCWADTLSHPSISAVGAAGGQVSLMDNQTGARILRLQAPNCSAPASDIAVSPDGRHIAAAFSDGTYCLWSASALRIGRAAAH